MLRQVVEDEDRAFELILLTIRDAMDFALRIYAILKPSGRQPSSINIYVDEDGTAQSDICVVPSAKEKELLTFLFSYDPNIIDINRCINRNDRESAIDEILSSVDMEKIKGMKLPCVIEYDDEEMKGFEKLWREAFSDKKNTRKKSLPLRKR